MTSSQLRQQLLDTMRSSTSSGLNRGATGNLSVRFKEGFLITPSGISPTDMSADDMVFMDMQGKWSGDHKPSSEWRLHREILLNRPEFDAVLHAHSTFATVLACLGKEIPPFHYMIAAAGGKTVRCAPYATFGTQTLAAYALEALQDRQACLLANHGLLVAARDLPQALALAIEVENLCEQYCHLLQIGTPIILSDAEMEVVLEKFKGYGPNAVIEANESLQKTDS
ncbi:MAG: class II aldolase/adducin family protein [Leptolyngbyaceae cyanobacterium MO_188.B28]|nr:class II aldolase/adducin family protein [Leptolyngbyaceae cyanobacterium MO_188.B28]